MGLTIHWRFKALDDWSKEQVREVLEKLRQRALDLPFAAVYPIVDVDAKGMDAFGKAEETRWMYIQAGAYVDFTSSGRSCSMSVEPRQLLGFEIDVGDGSEPMNVTLAQYPKTLETSEGRKRTGKKGWTGHGFCKTQYASTVSIPHFLCCHVAVCTLLDEAQKLGILEEVSDEGNYLGIELTSGFSPPKRSLEALANEVGEWNEMIAGLVSSLSEFEPPGAMSESPIRTHLEFDKLAAAGYSSERMVKLRAMLAQSMQEK